MDPISLAISTALANISQDVVRGAYAALKGRLRDKYGGNSGVVEAVEKLEEKPESKARQAVLQEEMISSGANQDKDLVQLANDLIEELKKLPGGKVDIKQDIQIRGDRNIVTGQGDVSVNE
jgi:hypothetical protein